MSTEQRDDMDSSGQLRLQVFLSHHGICSRRKAMEFVQSGKVKVNGQIQREPSFKVTLGKDVVIVNGQRLDSHRYDYVMLNKPEGYVTTCEDRFAQQTVLDLLPAHLRHLKPVGRLDKNTQGLLLLTNDGDLANRLTHPSFDVDKTYEVRITKVLSEKDRLLLEQGLVIEGKPTAPAKVGAVRHLKPGSGFEMTIHEGRKRQIRLMLATIGHHVVFLKRIRQGPLTLGSLPKGKFRVLSSQEIKVLKG